MKTYLNRIQKLNLKKFKNNFIFFYIPVIINGLFTVNTVIINIINVLFIIILFLNILNNFYVLFATCDQFDIRAKGHESAILNIRIKGRVIKIDFIFLIAIYLLVDLLIEMFLKNQNIFFCVYSILITFYVLLQAFCVKKMGDK